MRVPVLSASVSLLYLTGFCFVTTATAATDKARETTLAGFSIENKKSFAFIDPKTNYILVRAGECDGAHRSLRVYRNRARLKQSEDAHLANRLQLKVLPKLVTSQGIKLGDTQERVRQLLGSPTWSGGSLWRTKETVWSYHTLKGTRDKGIEYITLFRFEEGRIMGIELMREDIPRC